MPFEIDVGVEFEPVDLRLDLKLQLGGLPDLVSFGTDQPAPFDQAANRGTETFGGDLDVILSLLRVDDPAKPEIQELGPGLVFPSTIARDWYRPSWRCTTEP